ncbi:hypothetical protein Gpo141_00002469 [Globisporangium polare]
MGKKKVRSGSAATTSSSKMQTTAASATATAESQHLELDTRGDGMYSGTFRWLETKRFSVLPAFSATKLHRQLNQEDSGESSASPLAKGWEGYLAARSDAKTNLVAVASQDPSCLDALSFPITLLHVVQLLSLWGKSDSERHILVIGASSKAEQRIWRITDYWYELAHFFPATNVRLWFIGPEVQEDNNQEKPNLPSNLSVRHFRGTFGAFQDSHASHDCTPENTVIVGFNTGFGNFVDSQYYGLLFSWLPDLYKIADSNIPAIFTCANDYADMNGEFAVQSRVVGAKMLLLPQQNAFSCASHLHEEGQRETAWSRGNSFLYATQGYDSSRRAQLASGDTVALLKRLDADLDLHLQDSLGRHFFRGMVLSKEQASRCKALTGVAAKAASVVTRTKTTPTSTNLSALAKPQLQLIHGASSKEIVALVHIPKVLQPSERIVVDLSDSTLSVFVPGKYFLREKLPFTVPEGDSTANIHAELVLPVLRIAFMRS